MKHDEPGSGQDEIIVVEGSDGQPLPLTILREDPFLTPGMRELIKTFLASITDPTIRQFLFEVSDEETLMRQMTTGIEVEMMLPAKLEKLQGGDASDVIDHGVTHNCPEAHFKIFAVPRIDTLPSERRIRPDKLPAETVYTYEGHSGFFLEGTAMDFYFFARKGEVFALQKIKQNRKIERFLTRAVQISRMEKEGREIIGPALERHNVKIHEEKGKERGVKIATAIFLVLIAAATAVKKIFFPKEDQQLGTAVIGELQNILDALPHPMTSLDEINYYIHMQDRPEALPPDSPYDIEVILMNALEKRNQSMGTKQDAILDPYAVSDRLFGSKFVYTGIALTEAEYARHEDVVHRFAVRGKKSGCHANGNDALNYQYTSIEDAINFLLDVENMKDEEIIEWLIFTYEKSFGITLSPEGFSLERSMDETEILEVGYAAPDDTVEVAIKENVEGRDRLIPEKQPYVAGGRLLLPSGAASEPGGESGGHDLHVPVRFLKKHTSFDIRFGNEDFTFDSSELAQNIRFLAEKRRQYGEELPIAEFDGDGLYSPAEFIDFNDPNAKILADILTENAATPMEIIHILTTAVQDSMTYESEFEAELNRPALVTIFNKKKDCNAFVSAWAPLMAAKKQNFAIIYARQQGTEIGHVMGGIPVDTYEGSAEYCSGGLNQFAGYVPVDLVDSGTAIGDVNLVQWKILGADIFEYKDGKWDKRRVSASEEAAKK